MRLLRAASAAVALNAALAAASFAADLVLVRDGKSDYRILVARHSRARGMRGHQMLLTPEFAAKELRAFLKKITGADLPIVNRPRPGGKYIIVGEAMAKQVTGLDLKGVKPEGFLIVAKPPHLVIMGRDTPGNPLGRHTLVGTLFGVYDFLETFTDIRWYIPTDLGEVFTPQADLVVPANLRIHEEPSFIYRHTQLGHGISVRRALKIGPKTKWLSKAEWLWKRRNKVDGSRRIQPQHIWGKVVPLGEYYDRHPEFFALRDGRRVSSYRGHGGGGQLDTTNPELVALFAENVKRWLRAHPQLESHSLSLNDGGGLCQCARCRSVDIPELAAKRNYSDRLFLFYDTEAREIGREFPDKYFGIYAYGGLNNLPVNMKRASRQLFMEHVSNHMEIYGSRKAMMREINPIRAFAGFGLSMGYYSAATHRFNLFPVSLVRILEEFVPLLHANNVVGMYFYPTAEGDWGGRGLTFYVFARLGWDHKTDVEKLREEYFRRFYGAEAGRHVRRYHEILEKALKDWANDPKGYGGRDRRRVSYDVLRRTRPEARKALDGALAAAKTEKQKQRVELLNTAYRLAELMLAGVEIEKRIKRKPTRADVLAFKRVADEWQRLLFDRKEPDALAFSFVAAASYAKGYVNPDLAAFYVARHVRGSKKRVTCRATPAPPVLDGRLDDACWAKAKRLPLVGKDTGRPPTVGTTVSLCYDAKALYIAYRCDEPMMDKVRDSVVHRDGKVYQENEIEVFLDTNADRKTCFQFLANSLGTQADYLRNTDGLADAKWNPDWRIKTRREAKGWTAEVAIPFASLGVKPPVPGDFWLVNFSRHRPVIGKRGTREYSCLAPTFGKFYSPQFFAALIFR